MTLQEFQGWGRNFSALSSIIEPSLEDISHQLHSAERGFLASGLRRSYGDSSLNSGGLNIGSSRLKHWEFNEGQSTITVGAGLSIRELEEITLARGHFPEVVPGTGFVTIGGAIAADIHGKSHHKTGSFSSIIKSMSVLYADGNIRELTAAGETSEHFWATVGGLGLTGMILEATLILKKVAGDRVDVVEKRSKDLSGLLEDLKSADKNFEHTVAWVDLSGSFKGRGVVGMGNYSPTKKTSEIKKGTGIILPSFPNLNLITPLTVRAFNEMWFRKPLKNREAKLSGFMHPLDAIGSWNRIYGPHGFLQYQFAIPDGQEDFLFSVLARMKKIGGASFLGVLKRFGGQSQGYMSFPTPGWTLALDFPTAVPELAKTLNEIDQELCARGGRVYLIKDSRLKSEYVEVMYPRIKEWRLIRDQMDPNRLWQSDQGRRLKLC